MKKDILDAVLEIRDGIGILPRLPEITRVRSTDGKLLIECEDRADKSIVIGTGGWVVGKLASSMGLKEIRVESRLDNILKVRKLVGSLRSLSAVEDAGFVEFAKGVILNGDPGRLHAYVLGEEMIWACGMLEDLGCTPTLLHTGFIHHNVKDSYPKTSFVEVDCATTPYDERMRGLTGYVEGLGGDRKGNVLFGLFPDPLDVAGDLMLVDPGAFFQITHWERGRYEKRKYKSKVFEASGENRLFYITMIIGMAHEGLIEPSDAARAVCSVWPGTDIGASFDKDGMDGFVREYRISNALKRAKTVCPDVYETLNAYLKGRRAKTAVKALVAWSGGIDSTGCLMVAKDMGLDVDAATVCLPHIDLDPMSSVARGLGVDLVRLQAPMEEYGCLSEKAHKGDIHPCGQCSGMIVEEVLGHARDNGYELVIFGDMLSSGSQSIVFENGVYILNLPAALSLTKRDLTRLSGIDPSYAFGCPLLKEAHRANKGARRVSVQRVLRELRAQMLDKEFAYRLICDIMAE